MSVTTEKSIEVNNGGPAPAVFSDFAQVIRFQTGWPIPPLVAAQPRQQVAWAVRRFCHTGIR